MTALKRTPFAGSDVSVVIPAFNAARTIDRAVDSVFEQTIQPREVIVVDDGSADDTSSRLAAYGDRIRLVHQANAGPSAARNAGVALSSGALLAFLDSDDRWHSRKTERQLEIFNSVPDLAICRTRSRLLSVDVSYDAHEVIDSRPVEVVSDFCKVFLNPYFGTPTVMMRRDVFDACDGFDTSWQTAEDVDLWLRASYGRVIARLDERLVCITHSPTSLTARSEGRANQDNLRVIDAFAARHPAFASRHPFVVREARASVMRRIASEAFGERNVNNARRALLSSLWQNPLSADAIYLYLRSFLSRRP